MMTKFEEVSSLLTDSKENMREYCIYWNAGDKYATVNFPTTSKYATKVKRLAEKKPDEVRIFSETGGYIVAGIPVKAVKLNIIEGQHREYTEEELEELRERMKKVQEAKRNRQDDCV